MSSEAQSTSAEASWSGNCPKEGWLGLRAIYKHQNAAFAIVFVHGLDGSPYRSFTTQDKNGNDIFWPGKLLPKCLVERGCFGSIYGYGYDARTHAGEPISEKGYRGHAESLTDKVTREFVRDGTSGLPVVLIAHSFGGIIVQEALSYSWTCMLRRSHRDIVHRNLYTSTCGVFLAGVPNLGSSVAYSAYPPLKLMTWLVPGLFSTDLLRMTWPQNETTLRIIRNYFRIDPPLETIYLIESKRTPIARLYIYIFCKQIVSVESATMFNQRDLPLIYTDKDHLHLLKFVAADDPDFISILDHLVPILERARVGTRVTHSHQQNDDTSSESSIEEYING